MNYFEGFQVATVPISDVVKVQVPTVGTIEFGYLLSFAVYDRLEVVSGSEFI